MKTLPENSDSQITIVGYPKVGNTWFHYLFMNLYLVRNLPVRNHRILHNMSEEMIHYQAYWESHFDFSEFQGSKVIALIRDPRDVLVSFFMHNVFRENKKYYPGTVDEMVYDYIYGIEKFIKYYVIFFNQLQHIRDYIVWDYDEMSLYPFRVMKKIVRFLDIEENEMMIARVIHASSFKVMKNMEDLENYPSNLALKKSVNAHITNDAYKVRRGESGGYVNYLRQSTIDYINDKIDKAGIGGLFFNAVV